MVPFRNLVSTMHHIIARFPVGPFEDFFVNIVIKLLAMIFAKRETLRRSLSLAGKSGRFSVKQRLDPQKR